MCFCAVCLWSKTLSHVKVHPFIIHNPFTVSGKTVSVDIQHDIHLTLPWGSVLCVCHRVDLELLKRGEKRGCRTWFLVNTHNSTVNTFCGYMWARMCVCAFAEQSCEHAASWYVGMWLSDAFAPQWVSAYAHMLIEKSPPHLQHVCLLLESLFHIFQAIRWLREQITFVIRHDLKQKKNTWNKLSSLLFSEKNEQIPEWGEGKNPNLRCFSTTLEKNWQHCHHHRCTVELDNTQTALYLLMTHQYCDKVLCTTASVLLISLS